MKGGMRGKWK
ncbi:hypothetical protein KIPB_016697, partial [Kipferlia bialata]|eukprot:g16697.t1